jgi:two-component system response regulator QseB
MSPPGAPSILVVDDDIEMAVLLRDVLADEGFDTTAEFSGGAALAAVDGRPFDVVIVDKEMPGLNGLDLLAALRARLPGVRVVLLTAFGGALVARAARKRGADVYLDKPVRLADLVQTVRRLLGAPDRAS